MLRLIRDGEKPNEGNDSAPESDAEYAQGFTVIPAVVRSMKDGYAVAVFEAIARHVNANGEAWPSMVKLQEITGWSRKVVDPAIDRLIKVGALVREQRSMSGMKQSNLYRVFRERSDGSHSTIDSAHGTIDGSHSTNGEPESVERSDGSHSTIDSAHGTIDGSHSTMNLNPLTLLDNVKTPIVPTPKKTKEKKSLSSIPADFNLSPERIEYATSKGLSIEEAQSLIEDMHGWSAAKGGKYADWNAAFQNWVRRRVERRAGESNVRVGTRAHNLSDGTHVVLS